MVLLFTIPFFALSQKEPDKKNLNLGLGYHMQNNRAVFLLAKASTRIDGKYQLEKGVSVSFYLDSLSPANLMGKMVTDVNGLAKAILPPVLKPIWDRSVRHHFIAVSEASKEFETATAETDITKSRMLIDTISSDGEKKIMVTVTSFNGTHWEPVKDVEMRVGVYRSAGGILAAGDKETYTTDSSGIVTADFTRLNLPGDEKGNFLLVAKVDENEMLGYLRTEKLVPWGVAVQPDTGFFNQRTLWATRFRTPIWLLFMAYSIVIGVWGTLVYLIFQIIKIKKLGMSATIEK